MDDAVERNLHQVVETLSQYDPETLKVEPDESRDLLKGLYQYMIDRSVRHDLGEYYTPDWLAELVLDEVGYDGNPEKRFLDPACGSGTFLVLAINRIRMYAEERMIPQEQTLEYILKNVVGFDLNPLAVMAARTNYIIALGDLVRHRTKDLEIPVYLCDSVLAPEAFTTLYAKSRKLRTSVGDFLLPASVEDSMKISILTSTIEHCASNDYTVSEFLELAKSNLKLPEEDFEGGKELLREIYQKIARMEKDGIDGIWSRIIKNGFAPVYVGEFDFVIGNPPWVRWGFLSEGYRKATLDLWKNYGLFSLKGYASRLGGGEKDFSMLFTYACCDHYLKKHGSLGFLITQTVFKAKGAGEGFRRFRLGNREFLKIYKAHDFVDLRPFEDAMNLTAAVFIKKGEKTTYPISYVLWRKKEGQVMSPEMSLKAIKAKTRRFELSARPIGKETSPWQTADRKIMGILKRAKGEAAYRAFIGARAEPYGIFWVRIISKEAGNNLLVENLHDVGKTNLPRIQRTIESDFVFPFLRGKDITKWKAVPVVFALIVQDPNKKMGYEEKWMKLKKFRTYAYLKLFQDKLTKRANYLKYYDPKRAPFYSQYNVRPETFSPFKVVWKRMASQIEAAVVSSISSSEIGTKKVIPSDTTSFVPFEKEIEAHYVCALMNSSFVRKQITSFSAAGRGFGSPSILEYVGIPKFNSHDSQHVKIAELSMKAHKAMGEMSKEKAQHAVAKIENEIDIVVGQLFGLKPGELEQLGV
jgi:SAM-dependent methyltransferase